MATWINKDGLPVKFGLDEAKLGVVAGYKTDGPKRFVEVVIDNATSLPAFGNTVILDDNCSLPKGALIEEVTVGDVSTAFVSSGGGTISIGTIDKDRSSNGSSTALLSAATAAEMTTGNGAAGDGGQVGTILANAKLLTVTVGTADFSTGRGTVRIFYSIPKKGEDTDTLVYSKA